MAFASVYISYGGSKDSNRRCVVSIYGAMSVTESLVSAIPDNVLAVSSAVTTGRFDSIHDPICIIIER